MAAGAHVVVIVGSGVAGLSAAVEAAERGSRVIVVESEAAVGGASVMSGAGCCLVGTPEQAASSIRDSVELALADLAAFGGPTADLAWARSYLSASRTAVRDWCASLGITWTAPVPQEGNSVPRWHQPRGGGRAIVSALLGRCSALGVRIEAGAAATAIGIGRRGIESVTVRSGGSETLIPAGSVIVCSGGFVANRTMLMSAAPHLGALERLLCGGSPTAYGRGHQLLAGAGAAFANMDHIWVYPNGTPDPTDATGSRGMGVRGALGDIWLNREGRRYHDESLRGGKSGTNALLTQPGQTAWSVFSRKRIDDVLLIDNEYFATPAGPHPGAMERFWRQSRHAWIADSAAGLARAAGLPVHEVEREIERFNASVAAGSPADARFGRSLEDAVPLEGPLVAIQHFPMAQKNLGGVRTDLKCRVIDEASRPIPGLYAAGEVAGMAGGGLNGRAALEGTMFGPCLYSGRVAGAAASAR